MSSVVVLFSTKSVNVLKEVENDLLWYDSLLMKMKRFKGGCLEFEYGRDSELVEAGYQNPYRMIPKVSSIYKTVKEKTSNKEDIFKWFDNFQNYEDSNSVIIFYNDSEIMFDVPDDEVDSFLYNCERNSFNARVI